MLSSTIQSEQSRPVELKNRIEQIENLKLRLNFWNKNKPQLIKEQDIYVFALHKQSFVIASTNETTPEFVCKVSPNVVKALSYRFKGYGPLLRIRYKETKQCGKGSKDIFEVVQDYQPNYEQESEMIECYKHEQTARKEAMRQKRLQKKECPTNPTIETLKAIDSTTQQDTIDNNTHENNTLDNKPYTLRQESGVVELNIEWDNDAPYITTPLNAFSNKNAGVNTQLANIALELSKCDSSMLDYTSGATNNDKLVPLNNRFCDNVMICFDYPESELEHCPKVKAHIEKQRSKGSFDSSSSFEISKHDTSLYDELTHYYKERRSALDKVFAYLGIPTQDISATTAKWEHDALVQYIKVSLADTPLEAAFSLVVDNDTVSILHEHKFYVHDIDLTQDFAGTFNQQQLIKHLLSTGEFCIEGSHERTLYTIKDDDNKVGRSCLEIMGHDVLTGQSIRYKYYNKFIQSLESPGVRKTVGNHLSHWIHNPEHILAEAIGASNDTGLLRLEITYYMDELEKMDMETAHKHMDWLIQLMPTDCLYKAPIPSQWTIYASNITSNLCVIDTDAKKAFLSYCVNRLTGKINGHYIEGSKNFSNKISNILKQFTYRVPIYVVLYRKIGDQLAFQYNIYTKRLLLASHRKDNDKLQQLPTYLTCSCETFKRIEKEIRDDKGTVIAMRQEPQQAGLIDLPNVSFSYSPRDSLSKKTRNVPIIFDTVDWEALSFPTLSKTRWNKQKVEVDLTAQLIQLNKQQLTALREQNEADKALTEEARLRIQQQEQQRQETIDRLQHINNIADNKTRLLKLLNKPCGNASSLNTLDISTRLYVYGIRYTNTRYGENVILATNTVPENKDLCLYWANTQTKQFIDDNKDAWGWTEPNIILSPTNQPLALIEITDHYYNKSNHLCVRVSCAALHSTNESISMNQEELEKQLKEQEAHMEQTLINSPLLVRDRKLEANDSIDTVIKEGDIVFIQSLYPYRKSYIVQCSINNGEPLCLKSNRFLDELLEGATTKFKVMVGVRKLHPKTRRQCYSFIDA